jgi:hypothetical protein
MRPSPILSIFFSFLSLIQNKKSFHGKNRCHLLWSFVMLLFYFIKKNFLADEAHLNIMTRPQRPCTEELQTGFDSGEGDQTRRCPVHLAPLFQAQSSCKWEMREGRRGGGRNAQEAGVQVLRIPDITATTGSENTELTDRGLEPACRAQVDLQLHWTFLFVVINRPCIENTRVSNWHALRKEMLWKWSKHQAEGASPCLCSLLKLVYVHKTDI